MKKVKLLIILAVLSSTLLFGAIESVKSESFKIQAGYGDVSEVYITEIPAQGSSFLEGMPFNIEDEIVKYSNGGRGRTIAHFDVVSNSNCKIAVYATNLEWESNPEDPSANTPTSLSYILNLDFNVAYTSPDGSVNYSDNDTGFSVHSGREGEGAALYTGTIPENTYLSISNGTISFMFDESTSNRIHKTDNNDVYVGTYKGTVKITLEDLK